MTTELPCPARPVPGDDPVSGGLRCSRCGRLVQAATYRLAPGAGTPELVCDACRAAAADTLPDVSGWQICTIAMVCSICGRSPFPGVAEVWHVRPDLGRCWCPHCLAGAPQPEPNRQAAKDANPRRAEGLEL